MPEISAIENLCSPKKWAKVHQNFLGDATPKTSHHAKFNRDRSNQLGERGWSEKNFHTQYPDWLSRASQHARGATKKTVKLYQFKHTHTHTHTHTLTVVSVCVCVCVCVCIEYYALY